MTPEERKLYMKIYNKKYSELNKEINKEKRKLKRKPVPPKPIISDYEKKIISDNKRKDYYEKNKNKLLADCKKYRDNNKDKVKESNKNSGKKYRENNKEKRKLYCDKNKEKIKHAQKKYRENNKNKRKIYHDNRKKTDIVYSISINMRCNILKTFRDRNFEKPSKTSEILGCSFEELKQHLEKQFLPWMNWGNRGLYNGTFNYGWDIDHIKPLSSAKTEEDVIKLCYYTNLQPLCSKVNRDVKRAN